MTHSNGFSALRAAVSVRARRVAALAALGLGLALTATAADPETNSVSLEAARQQVEAGRAILIDVRESREHAHGVAAGARLLPMSQLAQRIGEIPANPRSPVFLVCNTQNRSSAVLRELRKLGGYGHVRFVEGGMSEWARRGWPLVRPGG